MGRRSPQSVLKRAREQALREKRERKQEKKAERAAARQEPELRAGSADGDVDDEGRVQAAPGEDRQQAEAPAGDHHVGEHGAG